MSHDPRPHPVCSFRSAGDSLERLASRCRVPTSDCADCAQGALLALLIAHPDWQIDSPRTIAWLRGAARNLAMNRHRERRRHPSVSLEDLEWDPVVSTPPLSQAGDDRDGSNFDIDSRVQALLDGVSEVNRQIFLQRAREGLGFSEIGSTVGLTAQQAKARYRRVVKALRMRISQPCDNAFGGGNQRLLMPDPYPYVSWLSCQFASFSTLLRRRLME